MTGLLRCLSSEYGIVQREQINNDGYWIFEKWFIADDDQIIYAKEIVKNLKCDICVNRYQKIVSKEKPFCSQKVPQCFIYSSGCNCGEEEGCSNYKQEHKKYTEKKKEGGVGYSKFVVRMEPKGESTAEKCCQLCPNRMRKMTKVEWCEMTSFNTNPLVFTDEVTAICDHMSVKTKNFLDDVGWEDYDSNK
ncbi:hypothetical protein KAR91_68855 [Candidatus Pacearchaeota archaeon]|nr:hypothetical protein [Candidatus Pacearchaeota archaeon]